MNDFYEKIASLIKDMKDFSLLFKLFLFNWSKEYNSEQLKIMKRKYMELLPTYRSELCPDFLQDTIKIIYLLDDRKFDIKDLLDLIQNTLDFEKVYEIFMKLLDEHNNIHDKTKDIIDGYFANSKYNSNPLSLVYLIKNSKNFRKEAFLKINKYNLTENDFLSLIETENFKLFKNIINYKIIDKKFENKGATYLKNIQTTISSLHEKIKNFDIKYGEISIFFQNEKKKTF